MTRDFAPGVAEQLAAIEAAGVTTSAVAKPAAAPVKHEIFYLDGGKPRLKAIDLEYPVSFDGREFRVVHIRRLTVGQVGAYFDAVNDLRKTDETTVVPFPMFVDADGADIPDGLINALDDDDMTRLNEALIDFLPRRFRMKPEAPTDDTPSPGIGASSASSSVGPPVGA